MDGGGWYTLLVKELSRSSGLSSRKGFTAKLAPTLSVRGRQVSQLNIMPQLEKAGR